MHKLTLTILGVLWVAGADAATLRVSNYTGTNAIVWLTETNAFVFPPGHLTLPDVDDGAALAVTDGNGALLGMIALSDYADSLSVQSQVHVIVTPTAVFASTERSSTDWTAYGFGVGFGWFGIGWIFKLVRRVAHTAPEI